MDQFIHLLGCPEKVITVLKGFDKSGDGVAEQGNLLKCSTLTQLSNKNTLFLDFIAGIRSFGYTALPEAEIKRAFAELTKGSKNSKLDIREAFRVFQVLYSGGHAGLYSHDLDVNAVNAPTKTQHYYTNLNKHDTFPRKDNQVHCLETKFVQ